MTTTYLVTNPKELDFALGAASGGDKIYLAPGEYGSFYIKNKNLSSNVTVTSLDPDRPASIDSMVVQGSSNITFSNLSFDRDFPMQDNTLNAAVHLQGSNAISIVDNSFSGGVVGDAYQNAGRYVGYGVVSVKSNNISVSNNSFEKMQNAVLASEGDNFSIVQNRVNDYRNDAFSLGRITNLEILKNHVSNPIVYSGDHPDFIEASNITNARIADNFLVQGHGNPTQGIGVGASPGEIANQNGSILITNNIIYSASGNSIIASNTANVSITNNYVLWNKYDSSAMPTIRIEGQAAENINIINNVIHGIGSTYSYLQSINANLRGNFIVQRDNSEKNNYYDRIFENARADEDATLLDFVLKPDALRLVGQAAIDMSGFNYVLNTSDSAIVSDPAPSSSPDLVIDFSETSVQRYSRRLQDRGEAEVLDHGRSLKVSDNGWKKVAVDFTLTEESVITFKIRIDQGAEIHAIGFETDERASNDRFFQLSGTERWGLQNAVLTDAGGETQTVSIAVGKFISGAVDRLVFVTDADVGPGGETVFSDVALHDVLL